MNPKKYNEYRVDIVGGKPDYSTKRLTKRGFVMIDENTAEINNRYTKQNRLFYELAEPDQKDDELEALKKQADELGIKYAKSISKENLQKKIETYQNE